MIQLLETGITRQIDSLTRLFQQNKANLPELRVSGRLTKVAFLFTNSTFAKCPMHWNVTSQNLSEHVQLWLHFLAGQYQNTYHMTLHCAQLIITHHIIVGGGPTTACPRVLETGTFTRKSQSGESRHCAERVER